MPAALPSSPNNDASDPIAAAHRRGDLHDALDALVRDHGIDEVQWMLGVVAEDDRNADAVRLSPAARLIESLARQAAGGPQFLGDALNIAKTETGVDPRSGFRGGL